MAYVKVDIVCPCGRLLMTKSSNPDSGSTTTGQTTCPSCKQRVAYQYRGAYGYASYKK